MVFVFHLWNNVTSKNSWRMKILIAYSAKIRDWIFYEIVEFELEPMPKGASIYYINNF